MTTEQQQGPQQQGPQQQGEQPQGPQPRRPFYVSDRWLRVRAEVERNRRGEYTVPTWVLALALAVMVGAIALGVALS